MPLLFRLEDPLVFSNFHSLPKRCLLSASADNQLSLALIDKIVTFKHERNSFKLTSRASSSSFPRNSTAGSSQLKSQENNSTYYYDYQKLMCSSCTVESPRFVWSCWTPKFKIKDGRPVCLLCTVTIGNAISIWLPHEDSDGNDLYTIENVLDLSNSLIKEVPGVDDSVFCHDSSPEGARQRVLFLLSNMGFSSCHFVEPSGEDPGGFLALVNLSEYILLVWVSKSKVVEDEEEKTEKRPARRSGLRGKKINIEGIFDMYQDEEEEPPKRKRKESDKVLGVAGFSSLNKDFYDLDNFDISKCKNLLPALSRVTQGNSLGCRTLGVVKVDSCLSLVSRTLMDRSTDVYFSGSTGIRKFNFDLETGEKGEVNLTLGPVSDVYLTPKAVESLKCFHLYGDQPHDVLAGISGSHFIVHDLDSKVTQQVACGTLPLLSFSLEPLFMAHGNLARVNLVNSEGAVHRLLIDSALKLEVEEVVDRGEDFVPCFTAQDGGVVVYECALNGSIFEVKYNLTNKSIFLDLLVLLQGDSDLGLFFELAVSERSGLVPNNATFVTKEGKNPFHTVSGVTQLLDHRESEDQLLNLFFGSLPVQEQGLKSLASFLLYSVAFFEASATLPLNADGSVGTERDLNFLPRMLKGVSLDRTRLLQVCRGLNALCRNSLLEEVRAYLAA